MKKIVFLAILITFTKGNAQKNLVQNGNFENEFQSWSGNVAALNPYDVKEGRTSASITQFVGSEWKGIDQTISVPKNTAAIEFSGWIKSDGIEKGENAWNTGKFDIEFLSGAQKSISNASVAAVLGSTPWTFYKKIIPLPQGTTKFRIMLALGQTNGILLFDDIKAIAISPEEYAKIQAVENRVRLPEVITDEDANTLFTFQNGDFELGNKNWRGSFTVQEQTVKEGRLACQLRSSEAVWTGIDQSAEVPEGSTSITIGGWLKSDQIQQGKEVWNNGLLNVEFTTDGSQKTGDDQSVVFVTGTTDWTYYSKTFPLPKNTKKYRIMVALGFATGTLYADNITITFQ